MIKKYHVSKNLINYTQSESCGIDASGNYLDSPLLWRSTVYTAIDNTENYTISFEQITNLSKVRINYYTSNNTHIERQEIDALSVNNAQLSIPNNAAFIKWTLYSTTTINISFVASIKIMLNEGSSALPYEPYGNTWKTVGYKKYGTETETFNTYPHEVIGDGQSNLTWSMDGNMQVNGTPTPQNPITPQETGEKTANLFDYSDLENGTINNNGEPVPYTGHKRTAHFINVESSTTYRLSNIVGSERVQYYDSTMTFLSNALVDNVFTTPNNCAYVKISGAATGWTQTTMLTKGSTAPSTFIPFGYEIPISFGQGTYTNYLSEPIRKIGTAADSMASTGTATHNITKYEFTGNESITKVNSTATNYLYYIVFTGTTIGGAMCSHLQYLSSGVSDNVGFSQNQTYPNTFYFNLGADIMNAQTSGNTAEGFKEWLTAQYAAGTPLTLWRILELPTTESFTAPSIPTSGTAQSFDVDTTLKPSEVSLTWHGWHEHEDTKFTT